MSAPVHSPAVTSRGDPSGDVHRAIQMIAYHFPPDREVGALRPAKIARSFRDRGFHVSVVAGPGEPATAADGVAVQRIPPSLDLRAMVSRAARSRKAAAGDPAQAAATDANWVPPDRVPAWKRWISSILWLPDDHQGWIPGATREAIRGIRAGASILYTTAPPHSSHIAGLIAKRRTGVFWIAEFRDPWTDNPWKPAFVRSRMSDAVDAWFEERCFRAADLIVTVTESFADTLKARLPAVLHDRIIVIRNGIDELAPALPAAPPRDNIELLYVGNLYHGRDPRPLFRAFGNLHRQNRLPAGARIELIGDCETYKGLPLAGMLDEHGITDRVVLRGRIPHDECLRRVADADLLLLFAQDQPLQVPNKLYEYLGARRPILAFVDAGGESEDMLREAGGHFVISSDQPDHIERVVEAAFRDARGGRSAPSDAVLEEWTTERQLAALHDALAARLR